MPHGVNPAPGKAARTVGARSARIGCLPNEGEQRIEGPDAVIYHRSVRCIDGTLFFIGAAAGEKSLFLLSERARRRVSDAAFLIFQEGYELGYGADGDHLKSMADIDAALAAGMPMITLDLTEVMSPARPPGVRRVHRDASSPKTAGTSWLHAVRTIARLSPALFRSMADAARASFPEASRLYAVSLDLACALVEENIEKHLRLLGVPS